ncbi:MAG TPA: PspC domain-containing protein [Phycicoccus sp.]|nr:PspC domain-containing protein [Phycicoccus sp.]
MPPPTPPPDARLPRARAPLERPLAGRYLGGVCVGIAEHLQVPVRAIRWSAVLLTLSGAGLPAYLFLWAVVPEARHGHLIDPASGRPSAPVERALAGVQRSRHGAVLAIGGLLVAVGLIVVLQGAGVDLRAGLLVPLLIVAGGAVVVWSDLDEVGRRQALGGAEEGRRGWMWLRLGLGLTLAVVGMVVLVVRGSGASVALEALLAAVAVLVGVMLVVAPWLVRLWTHAQREQQEAARANERADIAVHLHDSVLQTLALIQRRSAEPAVVARLARVQERELRAWLYAAPAGSEATLASAIKAVAHEVEDLVDTAIELVVTGDRPLEDQGAALTRALREALLNATRHGKAPVTAYVEIGPAGVEAFVRDRGAGFDLADVPEDRLGVRRSILGRMERHGGTARIRRREDGTEICLTLPPLEGAAS